MNIDFNNNITTQIIQNNSFLPKLVPSLPFSYKFPSMSDELPFAKKTKKLDQLIGQEKILKVLKEQTDLMEQVLMKYKEKNENRMEIYDKRLNKFIEKSEKIKERKVNYNVISEKIDQSTSISLLSTH